MKKLTLILTLFVAVTVNAQKINWITLEEAVEAQKTTPKKIFIDAYTTWCGPCKMLDKNTFQNKDVADYINENYYAVKFNAQGNETINFKGKTYSNPNFNPNKKGRNSNHELSLYFGVRAFPTLIFLDEEANLITQIRGYKTPQQIELYLKMFKNDDHINIKTQEAFDEYYKSFKPEFLN